MGYCFTEQVRVQDASCPVASGELGTESPRYSLGQSLLKTQLEFDPSTILGQRLSSHLLNAGRCLLFVEKELSFLPTFFQSIFLDAWKRGALSWACPSLMAAEGSTSDPVRSVMTQPWSPISLSPLTEQLDIDVQWAGKPVQFRSS